jgi:hypothetical protein
MINEDLVEVDIFYKATASVDFTELLKAGDRIELNGKSVFRFENDKIIELVDII